MKHIKIYENYLSDKMKNVKDKFNKLKLIIDFMEKYKMKYFILGLETPNGDYTFEEVILENNNYYLVFDTYNKKETISNKIELTELTDKVVDELISSCKNENRFDVEYHLENSIVDIEIFLNIIRIHKEPIKFNDWMFSMLLENDMQDKANTFYFQNILFTTHPESFTAFMDECIDSKKRSKGEEWEPLKIAPRIEKKFKHLFDDYEVLQNSKKYNI